MGVEIQESDSLLSDDNAGLFSSINVTPFVDVVLVLLVIFMVTAPMIAKDIMNIHLPKSSQSDAKVVSSVALVVNKQGQYLFDGELLSDDQISEKLKQRLSKENDLQSIIAADEDCSYGRVAHLIEIVKASGVQKFAIQIEKKQ